ncbi:flagellar hook-length control protein FliK [Achromobacter sp. 413638]|uniref:flagellar hook-length control protein FliK n=1 Tax=Achromobacter sp. 413638 TaxID=3342385 RepID=UPI00370CC2AC
MSVGPAALGNVLVQRLDAVLGTTMSAASANQVSGARPDAVSQPGSLEKPGQADGSPRDPRQGVQTGGARGERAAIVDAKTAAALALAARGLVTSNDTTASAPTTLGRTARAILSLLAQYPDAAPPVQGRAPLWTPDASAGRQPGATAGQPAAGQPAPGGQPPAPHANTPAGQPQAAAANSAANVATVLNAIAGDPATAVGKTPGQTGATEGAPPAQAPAAAARAALAAQGPAARALGQALREALQTSGLFYESHLADLAFGRANPSELRKEPQADLKQADAQQQQHSAAATRARAEAPASRGAGGADAPASGGSNAPAPGTPINGIHQDLNALVRQQLDVLANQALAWRGEAWPGTPMDWEVQRDPYGGDPESAVPTWATRLKLDLPRLGLVDARLNLAGDQIVLQLVAPHSAALIDESSDQLRSRLLAAGLTLSHMTVNVVDPRPIIPTDF